MLKSDYTTYESALDTLQLENLTERRETLCLTFARQCLKYEKTKEMFPLNTESDINLRNSEKFIINFASTARLQKCAIPIMQRLLNENS